MKYRALFLVKLSYYLLEQKITLDTNLYSILLDFIYNFDFTINEIEIIKKMAIYDGKKYSFSYKVFLDSYNFIKEKLYNKDMIFSNIENDFYQLYDEDELVHIDELVWYFYNYYADYLYKVSDGKELLPYDYRNSTKTKIYVIS